MTDFNEYFAKSTSKAKPNNEKDPKRGGKHAARVSTVRAGAGGVSRDGAKPHKTNIDSPGKATITKSFPVGDAENFHAVQYVQDHPEE